MADSYFHYITIMFLFGIPVSLYQSSADGPKATEQTVPHISSVLWNTFHSPQGTDTFTQVLKILLMLLIIYSEYLKMRSEFLASSESKYINTKEKWDLPYSH